MYVFERAAEFKARAERMMKVGTRTSIRSVIEITKAVRLAPYSTDASMRVEKPVRKLRYPVFIVLLRLLIETHLIIPPSIIPQSCRLSVSSSS